MRRLFEAACVAFLYTAGQDLKSVEPFLGRSADPADPLVITFILVFKCRPVVFFVTAFPAAGAGAAIPFVTG
jgi:hypothetical protein